MHLLSGEGRVGGGGEGRGGFEVTGMISINPP